MCLRLGGFFDEFYQKKLEKFCGQTGQRYAKAKRQNLSKGLLLGILDLREQIQKDIKKDICYRVDYNNGLENESFFGKRVAPYIILAGIVVA